MAISRKMTLSHELREKLVTGEGNVTLDAADIAELRHATDRYAVTEYYDPVRHMFFYIVFDRVIDRVIYRGSKLGKLE